MVLLTGVSLTKVPDPGTLSLFAVALAGIAGMRQRRRTV